MFEVQIYGVRVYIIQVFGLLLFSFFKLYAY